MLLVEELEVVELRAGVDEHLERLVIGPLLRLNDIGHLGVGGFLLLADDVVRDPAGRQGDENAQRLEQREAEEGDDRRDEDGQAAIVSSSAEVLVDSPTKPREDARPWWSEPRFNGTLSTWSLR